MDNAEKDALARAVALDRYTVGRFWFVDSKIVDTFNAGWDAAMKYKEQVDDTSELVKSPIPDRP